MDAVITSPNNAFINDASQYIGVIDENNNHNNLLDNASYSNSQTKLSEKAFINVSVTSNASKSKSSIDSNKIKRNEVNENSNDSGERKRGAEDDVNHVLIAKSKQAKLTSSSDNDNKDDMAPISHDTNSRGAGGVKSRTIQSYFAPQGQDGTAAAASSMPLLSRSESLNTGTDRVSGDNNTSPSAKDVKNKNIKPATAKPAVKDTLSSSSSSSALTNTAEIELKKQLQQLKILKEQGKLPRYFHYIPMDLLVSSRFKMSPSRRRLQTIPRPAEGIRRQK